jgi:hypothetical protein
MTRLLRTGETGWGDGQRPWGIGKGVISGPEVKVGGQARAGVLNRLFFAEFERLHVLYHTAKRLICGIDVAAE